MTRVVVLGGGIAGLTTAFRRASMGETIVLEAGSSAGGSIRTIREDGFTLECGPNTLRTTEAAERLLVHLGLESRTVNADRKAPRWIVRGGSPRAVVPGPAALFNTVFTTRGKLRLLKEPFVAPRPASLEDESVHSFFARRFGEEAALYGAGPMVSGVYAGDPRSLSMRSAFPRLWLAEERSGSVIRDFLRRKKKEESLRGKEKKGGALGGAVTDGAAVAVTAGVSGTPARHRPRTLTFDGGLFTLIESLEQHLSSRPGFQLELNAAVVAVEGPRDPAPPGRRWTVHTADGRSFDADVVVSTLSAPADARLLGGVLTRSSAALALVPYSPVTVVLQAYRAPASPRDAPHGFGGLIPQVEGFRSLGILYPASLFTGRAPEGFVLTTSFLGGALDRALASAPDADLLAVASSEVARFFPRLGAAARSWIARWPEAIPQLPLGHHRTLAALEEDLAALGAVAPGGLHVTGGFRDGIALGERIASGETIGESLA
ncbi:MAG TPA: protoporphyrinogen oxidase [Thermoanaerobaculia bacterium]|nr:protoporphyrinogen oxidase [Thermoanaerobaculia bacterium]